MTWPPVIHDDVSDAVGGLLAARITPEQHGAVGDGVADDSTAVQDALDAITAGSTVILAGTYKVTSALTVSDLSHFAITGPGRIQFAATVASSNGDTRALSISNCTDFVVTGLAVEVITQNQQYTGISVSGGSQRGSITRCRVSDARWVGISVYDATPGTTKSISITDNTIETCRFGVDTNGQWITVARNLIADYWLSSSEASVSWTSSSVYWDAIIISDGATECTVSDNTIVEPGQSGVYVAAATNCVITGNSVYRAQNKGIDIGPTSGTASGIMITGNLSVDAATGNFHLYETNYSVVSGNVSVTTDTSYFGGPLDTSGIILNAVCLNNTVVGNTVSMPTGMSSAGIFVNASAPASTGNIIGPNAITATTPMSVDSGANTVFS